MKLTLDELIELRKEVDTVLNGKLAPADFNPLYLVKIKERKLLLDHIDALENEILDWMRSR